MAGRGDENEQAEAAQHQAGDKLAVPGYRTRRVTDRDDRASGLSRVAVERYGHQPYGPVLHVPASAPHYPLDERRSARRTEQLRHVDSALWVCACEHLSCRVPTTQHDQLRTSRPDRVVHEIGELEMTPVEVDERRADFALATMTASSRTCRSCASARTTSVASTARATPLMSAAASSARR